MPKLSVIIPVYNTEKYLTKCLNSVCNQTLFDIEIICINDCSTDKSFEIVKQFALKDKRIKHLDLKENKGASNARNLGINEAKGEFIAFLDSDDYPERNDFYEKLYLKAKEENSDIIKGCYKNSDTGFIDKAINDKIRLDKNNFCATYTSAIFKSELIKENKIKFPLISDMEDPVFAFSCALNANKISLIDELNLIVTKRPDSLTSRVMSFKQIVDKFEGLKMIVDIANNSKTISSESYNFVVGYWANIVYNDTAKYNKDEFFNYAKEQFYKIIKNIKNFNNFLSYTLNFGCGLYDMIRDLGLIEDLKSQIDKHKIISFDIFDTLLFRPFLKPDDLFFYMQKAYDLKDFYSNRTHNEDMMRRLNILKNPNVEDITYDDIYKNLQAKYPNAKKLEQQLEMELIKPNGEMLEIFNYAKSKNKRIIITSDMYYDSEFLSLLLKKNGFKGFEKLYVSSQTKVCKASGKMYKYVIKDLDVSPNDILHIGDNKKSDFMMAIENNLSAYYFETNNDYQSSSLYKTANNFYRKHESDFPAALAYMAYNKIKSSDNNYKNLGYWHNLGYMVAGPLVMALYKSINDISKYCAFSDLFFIARDCYPIKAIFDKYPFPKTQNSPKIHYIYAQRQIAQKCLNPINYNKETFDEYKNYMNSIKLNGSRIGVVDACTDNFSAQRLVEKFFGDKFILGMYLTQKPNPNYNSICLFREYNYTVGFNWDLIEHFLTSMEPLVVDIKDNKPVYDSNISEFDKIKQNSFKEIFNGEMMFVDDFMEFFKPACYWDCLNFAYEIICSYWKNLSDNDIKYLSLIKHPQDIQAKSYRSLNSDWAQEFKEKIGVYA